MIIKLEKHGSFFDRISFLRTINGYSFYSNTILLFYVLKITYKRNAIKCIYHYMKTNITKISYKQGKIIWKK